MNRSQSSGKLASRMLFLNTNKQLHRTQCFEFIVSVFLLLCAKGRGVKNPEVCPIHAQLHPVLLCLTPAYEWLTEHPHCLSVLLCAAAFGGSEEH